MAAEHPSPAAQAAALAALLGRELDSSQRHDLAMVAMIAEAKRRGISWRQMATVLGCHNGAEAKRAAKKLARTAQAAMLRAEVGAGGR